MIKLLSIKRQTNIISNGFYTQVYICIVGIKVYKIHEYQMILTHFGVVGINTGLGPGNGLMASHLGLSYGFDKYMFKIKS